MGKSNVHLKLILVGVVVFLFFISYIYDLSKTPNYDFKMLKDSIDTSQWTDAPDVIFSRLDGTSIRLNDYNEKIVLLNFWTSWCGPCINEFPSLLKLVEHFKGEVVLIAVSNDDALRDIERFIALFNEEYSPILNDQSVQIVWDKDKSVSLDIFHTQMYPETILIAKNGKLAKKFIGEVDWFTKESIEFIDSVLNLY